MTKRGSFWGLFFYENSWRNSANIAYIEIVTEIGWQGKQRDRPPSPRPSRGRKLEEDDMLFNERTDEGQRVHAWVDGEKLNLMITHEQGGRYACLDSEQVERLVKVLNQAIEVKR